MRMVFLFALLGLTVGCGSEETLQPNALPSVDYSTLTWTRNQEVDMQDYFVYACWTVGCTLSDDQIPEGVVLHPPVGTEPEFMLDLTGKVGALAVSARNTSLLVSELSESIQFDHR